MRIAYVTLFDATDIKNWSGTDLHIWQSLQKQGAEIELIGNLRHGPSLKRRLRRLWGTKLERRGYLPFWNLQTAQSYAKDAAQRLEQLSVDVVVSPSPIPLAFMRCPQPKILWTDANFSGLSPLYDEFSLTRLSSVSITDARRIECRGAKNCDGLVYAADWGADRAIAAGADPKKVAVVPYGANLAIQHGPEDVIEFVKMKAQDALNLLFVGVDWHRKGADKAIAVVRELNSNGTKATLTIVGCEPPKGLEMPAFVRCEGFISKHSPQGQQRLAELYRSSHFLIVPTVAEAYGLVFAEASAYGLPSLSHRIGGVPTIVRDGANGQLFETGDPVSAWCQWILEQTRIRGRLEMLARSCYADYSERLNWDAAGRSFTKILERVVGIT